MIHAVYPGSFDPVTNGHIDIILRARRIFEDLTVAVACNPSKTNLFTPAERVEMIREVVRTIDAEVHVDSFNGLLVNYAKTIGAAVIVRGLRALSDFEFEYQLSLMNRRLQPDIQMVYLMSGADVTYLSSGLVKEVASLGGDISELVPDAVKHRLLQRLGK
ncbi:pantetheine-phosphate adenylyltransferase [bacterium]|nr:pantetheine-phosphate adenylyltransferase [candidate division CSSED10-310 bacterium]